MVDIKQRWCTVGMNNWRFGFKKESDCVAGVPFDRLRATPPVEAPRVEEQCLLFQHSETEISRHIKVKGIASPYNGDTTYWASRMGKHPEVKASVRLRDTLSLRCPELAMP